MGAQVDNNISFTEERYRAKCSDLYNRERMEGQIIILHIFPRSVFLRDFVQFLERNYDPAEHGIITFGKDESGSIERLENAGAFDIIDLDNRDDLENFNNLRHIIKKIGVSDIDLIVLHSLTMSSLDIVYFILHPQLIRKTVWVIWGADLYDITTKVPYMRPLYFTLKKVFARNIPYVVARPPDYKRLQQWYRSSATHIYVEPLYGGEVIANAPRHSRDHASQTFNIILGNSATKTNRHLDALEILSKYKDADIKIHIPLSYGDAQYAEMVKTKARSIFGEKVVFLETFMPPDEYWRYLTQMDIAIFNNNRQQALGNLAYMLATGAKIYLNDDSALWEIFTGLNFTVHSINNLREVDYEEFVDLDQNELDANSQNARKIYSEEHSVMCWNKVFALANKS